RLHACEILRPQWGPVLICRSDFGIKSARVTPQRWNRYAYVLNNPIRLLDPTGRDDECSGCEIVSPNVPNPFNVHPNAMFHEEDEVGQMIEAGARQTQHVALGLVTHIRNFA